MKAAPTEPPTPPPVWRRIRRSAFAGFRWSLGLCVIVLVQALVGSASLHGAPALRLLLVFYAAAGTSLGALTGLLVPIMHTLVGAVAVMVICGFTLHSGVILIADGPGAYHLRDPLFLGLAVGGLAGVALWWAIRSGKVPPAA